MIQRVIHYCWFGGKTKPKIVKKCIKSWKKHCPHYQIREWNENNFNVLMNVYTKYCFENKKWAYLSDFVRLWVIYHYGGVYLDTDVELVKNMDDLLENEAFFGFENKNYIASGLGFGAEKNHSFVYEMLQEYNTLPQDESGNIVVVGCPILNTKALKKLGVQINGEFQRIGKTIICPMDYFNPYNDSMGKLRKTENTYSIHWYCKSALNWKLKLRSRLTRLFHRMFGQDCFRFLKRKK